MEIGAQKILEIAPYSLPNSMKQELLFARLKELTELHYEKCAPYRRMLDGLGYPGILQKAEDIPFLPVRMFKKYDLLSVDRTEIIKTMTSSGTTGQAVSRIYLDRTTSTNQQKALVKIVSSFIGQKRLPMIILDTSAVLKDRNMFSARAAGILGFTMFSSEKLFALDDDMQLDVSGIEAFLEKHAGEDLLLFGFTFMVWQHFYRKLIEKGYHPDLSRGTLIHGGGWKKLISESVSPQEFKRKLNEVSGISRVHDYYGMVEQTGTIYMECEHGHLHAPVFSDIIIRRPIDFSPAGVGEKGIIEVLSLLPESYPGHALLTEDEGILQGEDDCPCGRLGKSFKVVGRLSNAEIRGCSDTYAASYR